MTHLRTSQTSPGWVTSCLSPRHDPDTPVLRISVSEASGQTARDAHKGNSGVIMWRALLNRSSSPIKGTFFFYILFQGFFSARCYLSSFSLQRRNLILWVFFPPPQILSETDKPGSTVGLVSGCTRKSFTSRSAVTEFIAKVMK